MMTKTKIDWCDYTWNPVWGCENNCSYCYARKLSKRFYKRIFEKEFNWHYKNYPTWAWTGDHLAGLKSFKPTWLESNFDKPFPKKPSRIFVNSMSDIDFWKSEWWLKVLDRIEEHPEHKFLFLTKRPAVYLHHDFPDNCWLGATATNWREARDQQDALSYLGNTAFLSIEPILGAIPGKIFDSDIIDWLIVGAETGNRKGKVIPRRMWIEEFIESGIPLFMKESLKNIWKGDLIQEYPEDRK